MTGDTEHVETSKEKRVGSFQISRTKRTAPLPCDCLRQRRTEKGRANSLLPRYSDEETG